MILQREMIHNDPYFVAFIIHLMLSQCVYALNTLLLSLCVYALNTLLLPLHYAFIAFTMWIIRSFLLCHLH